MMKRPVFFALAGMLALSSCMKEEITIDGITWAARNVGRPGKFVDRPALRGRLYNFVEAQTACPVGWRLPTLEELRSLADADSQWGGRGRAFGNPKNPVFFPAAGNRLLEGNVKGRGKFGAYWSSDYQGYFGNSLYFDPTSVYPNKEILSTVMAGYGLSVRCVKEGSELVVAEFDPDEKGGVIDGVTWATRNVGERGRFVARPEDRGEFYYFEEAQTACPTGWRLPTLEEIESLSKAKERFKPDRLWTNLNDRAGIRLGRGDNTIFLPSAGFNYGHEAAGTFRGRGAIGNYWSSEPFKESQGYILQFTDAVRIVKVTRSDKFNPSFDPTFQFAAGLSVRCVRE